VRRAATPDDGGFPPPPWRLRGEACATVWRVPVHVVRGFVPEPVRAVAFGGRAFIVTGLARYGAGSLLAYDELLAGVWVRLGRRMGFTVTHAWVNDARSRDGGRALWGIPKELAAFAVHIGGGDAAADDDDPATLEAAVSAEGAAIAGVRFAAASAPALRWRKRSRTFQPGAGGVLETAFRTAGRLEFGWGDWTFNPRGPLHFLGPPCEALATVRLRDAVLDFGA
jgi:hypothetical protein